MYANSLAEGTPDVHSRISGAAVIDILSLSVALRRGSDAVENLL